MTMLQIDHPDPMGWLRALGIDAQLLWSADSDCDALVMVALEALRDCGLDRGTEPAPLPAARLARRTAADIRHIGHVANFAVPP
jgi:hypothetical protein